MQPGLGQESLSLTEEEEEAESYESIFNFKDGGFPKFNFWVCN